MDSFGAAGLDAGAGGAYDARTGRPVSWTDTAPYNAWAIRVGKARYELMKPDAPDADEEDEETQQAWAPIRTSGKTPLSFLNSLPERMTVAEREATGATAPWTSGSWAATRRRLGHPVPPLPPAVPEEDDLDRQSRDRTCTIAPWWDE